MTRDEVNDWLRLHDIDPSHVSRTHGVRIVLGRQDEALIEVHEYVMDSQGRRFIDDMTSEAAIAKRMVPLKKLP